jgi:hydroxyacylglutathione hydrolase
MTAHVFQFMCLEDNFGVLIHDSETRATAAIDAPEAEPILRALEQREWALTDIIVTHRHGDHTQGIPELKARYPRARVVGPAIEAAQIPHLERAVGGGDLVQIGSLGAEVLETPGHTRGHIVYWFEEEDVLFAGDTLFAMGCGRVFETPPEIMWRSLCKLAALPPETKVYCGHEYTLANGLFALGVEPGNSMLAERVAEVRKLREEGRPTLPTTIGLELATNPFLRAEIPEIQAAAGLPGADPAAVFAALRERKNRG